MEHLISIRVYLLGATHVASLIAVDFEARTQLIKDSAFSLSARRGNDRWHARWRLASAIHHPLGYELTSFAPT